MIHGTFGKLGAGKGIHVMNVIFDELFKGHRDVVTNVPLRLQPWVNGQGKAQIGFDAYLKSKGVEEFDWGRVKVIEDVDALWDMFMWRRDGVTGEWFKMATTHDDEKGRPDRFDPNEAKARHCAPVLCVTDEAWICYPNNGGWARSPLIPFYARQSRKLRDEWYIITQHPTDVDNVIWNITQDFTVCRNHGMERMGFFRQPAMFRTITYLTNPAKGNAIRSHETYARLDAKGLCQCYDTTAGVGFSGGFAGDAGQKRKGLHIGWLLLAIVLGVVLLASVPFGLGKLTKPFLTRTLSGGHIPAATNAAPIAPALPVSRPNAEPSKPQASAAPGQAEPVEITCTGYLISGKVVTVFFSDGSTVDSDSGRIAQVYKNAVVIDGKSWPVVTARLAPYQPDNWAVSSSEASIALPASTPPVNRADVLGGIRGQGGDGSTPRLNGYASMRGVSLTP